MQPSATSVQLRASCCGTIQNINCSVMRGIEVLVVITYTSHSAFFFSNIPASLSLVFQLFSPITNCTHIPSRSLMSTAIPPGVDLNDDLSPHLIRSVVACCILSGLALAGRLASRKIQKSNLLASDYLVAGGLVGSWVISGITIDGEQSCLNSQRRRLILIPFSGSIRPWQAYRSGPIEAC